MELCMVMIAKTGSVKTICHLLEKMDYLQLSSENGTYTYSGNLETPAEIILFDQGHSSFSINKVEAMITDLYQSNSMPVLFWSDPSASEYFKKWRIQPLNLEDIGDNYLSEKKNSNLH